MKCPNDLCGGKVEEYVRDDGHGSRYCLDACGYYEEFATSRPVRRRTERVPPVKRSPPQRRRRD